MGGSQGSYQGAQGLKGPGKIHITHSFFDFNFLEEYFQPEGPSSFLTWSLFMRYKDLPSKIMFSMCIGECSHLKKCFTNEFEGMVQ